MSEKCWGSSHDARERERWKMINNLKHRKRKEIFEDFLVLNCSSDDG